VISHGRRKGQSVVEFAMLIAIVATALMAMSIYIMRLVNVHSQQTQEQLNYCWNRR
jgi:hypothetical protein